jgi:hypothetical protein
MTYSLTSTTFLLAILAAACPLSHAQIYQTNDPLPTEVRQIGDAEVKSIAPHQLFCPNRQPSIYWHDPNWKIDLILAASGGDLALNIRSSSGGAMNVPLPSDFGQVESVLRSPGNKAVVTEINHWGGGFAVVNLATAQVLDELGILDDFSVSPNGRFILFGNWTGREDEYPAEFHLYDTAKTPRENVCGFQPDDPKHQRIDDSLRGFQVFPQRPGQTHCSDHQGTDDNVGLDFTWSPDSSRVVFIDQKGEAMSLVLVTMPTGPTDRPITSIHPLNGNEDVCVGLGSRCGPSQVVSLDWQGDAVHAVFYDHGYRSGPTWSLTLPPSKFTPIASLNRTTQAQH